MKEYILVINYVRNKPVALVRSEFGRAKVIAGEKSAERVFLDGDPHNINRKYGFTLLGHSSPLKPQSKKRQSEATFHSNFYFFTFLLFYFYAHITI